MEYFGLLFLGNPYSLSDFRCQTSKQTTRLIKQASTALRGDMRTRYVHTWAVERTGYRSFP